MREGINGYIGPDTQAHGKIKTMEIVKGKNYFAFKAD